MLWVSCKNRDVFWIALHCMGVGRQCREGPVLGTMKQSRVSFAVPVARCIGERTASSNWWPFSMLLASPSVVTLYDQIVQLVTSRQSTSSNRRFLQFRYSPCPIYIRPKLMVCGKSQVSYHIVSSYSLLLLHFPSSVSSLTLSYGDNIFFFYVQFHLLRLDRNKYNKT